MVQLHRSMDRCFGNQSVLVLPSPVITCVPVLRHSTDGSVAAIPVRTFHQRCTLAEGRRMAMADASSTDAARPCMSSTAAAGQPCPRPAASAVVSCGGACRMMDIRGIWRVSCTRADPMDRRGGEMTRSSLVRNCVHQFATYTSSLYHQAWLHWNTGSGRGCCRGLGGCGLAIDGGHVNDQIH